MTKTEQVMMRYRYLGRTGLQVSELCLGAMTFGRESSEEVSFQLLDRFVEAGGNFIDTADVYSHGISEEILGRWLKGRRRDDFVIATKVRFAMGAGPNDLGLSRKHIFSAVEDSLRRLDTSYIDLYQVHMWDPGTALEETLSALHVLVETGKVRYLGASNYAGYQLQKAIDISRQNSWEPFACLQPLYNLLDRSFEWELGPVCAAEGVGVIPWSPLRGGWLSGKYQRGMSSPPPQTRVEEAAKQGWSESWDAYANERTWQVVDCLSDMAKELNKTPAQVALNWLLQKSVVTAPIIGARTLAHLDDNLGATGWSLPAEQVAELDQASHSPLPYPYESLAQQRAVRGR
jgi:aryl-alcohol dehydrogenase-like predicted oxidoreductase